MLGCYQRHFGQQLRTLQLHFLLAHLDRKATLLQGQVALQGHLLPVAFGQRGHVGREQRSVGDNLGAGRQMQGGHQLMVHDAAGVFHLRQLQLQRFALQLVAGDVVLQGGSLVAACLHVTDYLFGQFQILLQNLTLIAQLIDVQVVAYQQEADFLTVLLRVQSCHLLAQFGQGNAAVHRTTGVNHLLRLKSEVVAEVGHRNVGAVAEVAVPQAAVAQVADRQTGGDIGQTLCLGGLQRLVGSLAGRGIGLNTLAVFVGQAEHLIDAQQAARRSGLGVKARTAQHCHTQRHESFSVTHKHVIIEVKGYGCTDKAPVLLPAHDDTTCRRTVRKT